MKRFFEPEKVALIGASARPLRPGNNLCRNMDISFGENFYPINPRVDSIEERKCYSSILEVPDKIDLAVVFIQSQHVPSVLEQCAQKGIQRVIIESGGFSEVGEEGSKLADTCMAIARKNQIRIWGPNCMGLINVSQLKVLSFLRTEAWQDRFIRGSVSMIVQSGMLSAGFLTNILYKNKFGISKIASIGNKMDIDEVDVLDYLVKDPETEVIAMYLESLRRGRELLKIAQQTDKKIVVLKSGRTIFGAQAAQSHTAALAQNDRIVDSAFRQAGIIRATNMYELIDVARFLVNAPKKVTTKPRIAILTFSGGAGVVSSDDIFDLGMELVDFQPRTISDLKEVFPPWMEPSNPVDLYPAIERNGVDKAWLASIKAVLTDPGVEAIVTHLFCPPFIELPYDIQTIAEAVKNSGKVMTVWIMGAGDNAEILRSRFNDAGIPAVDEIYKASRVLAALLMRR